MRNYNMNYQSIACNVISGSFKANRSEMGDNKGSFHVPCRGLQHRYLSCALLEANMLLFAGLQHVLNIYDSR